VPTLARRFSPPSQDYGDLSPSPVLGGVSSPTIRWVRLVGPAAPLNPSGSLAIVAGLRGIQCPLILAIIVTGDMVDLGIRCATRQAEEVERALRGVCPGC